MSVTVDGVGEVMALLVEMGRPIILVGPAGYWWSTTIVMVPTRSGTCSAVMEQK